MAPRGKAKKAEASADPDGGTAGETRRLPYRDEPDQHYSKNMEKINSERIFILKAFDKGEYGDLAMGFSFLGSSGSSYTVTIGSKVSCNCESGIFRGPACKHVMYTLTFALKAEEPLRWQHAFLKTELEDMFANLRTYPLSSGQVSGDPAMTDGVPKSTDLDCPVCYKTCSDDTEPTVCCTSCGHHAHKICFNTGNWGAEGIAEHEADIAARKLAEKQARAAERAAQTAARREEKAAEKSAEKAARAEARAQERAAAKAAKDAEKAAEKAAKAAAKAAEKAATKAAKEAEKAAEKAAKAEAKAAEKAAASPATKGRKRAASGEGGRQSKKAKVSEPEESE